MTLVRHVLAAALEVLAAWGYSGQVAEFHLWP